MGLSRIFVLAVPLAVAAFAQSSTVLLQRGIFLDETVGDIDGAIAAYRKILGLGSGERAYETEAQIRLGACLLRKRDRQPAAPNLTHYVDPLVGYSFTVPSGWGFRVRLPFGGGPGNCTDFTDPERRATVIFCAKPEKTNASGIDDRLKRGEEAMIASRRKEFPDFTLRAGSPVLGSLEGQRTISVLADHSLHGRKWTDQDTWIQTGKTRSSFTVYSRTADMEDVRARVMPILNSIRIP